MKLSIIVAMGRNRAIGYRNKLLWNLPEDMQRFKRLTMGHSIVMGRKTYESLPHGALPGRRNLVVSRTQKAIPNAEVFSSLQNALMSCQDEDEVFVIGGATLYKEALPLCNTLYLTLVDDAPTHADTFFPDYDLQQWHEVDRETHDGFSFVTYEKDSNGVADL